MPPRVINRAGMQQAVMAVQKVLPKADVAVGVALMFFCQKLNSGLVSAKSLHQLPFILPQ